MNPEPSVWMASSPARTTAAVMPLLLLMLACCFSPREDPAPPGSGVTVAPATPAVPPTAETVPRELGCITAAETNSSMTPVELYAGMETCALADRAHDAAFLFALAGVYGRFDTYRVARRAGHDAPTIIRQGHMRAMSPEQLAAVRAEQAQMATEPQLTQMCAELRRAGHPTYEPEYMIRHGATIFIPDTTPALVAGFDPVASWNRALDEYVHCAPSP